MGGDKGARDLLAQLQQLSEAASGEMWDHYQSMIRRVQKDILVCLQMLYKPYTAPEGTRT